MSVIDALAHVQPRTSESLATLKASRPLLAQVLAVIGICVFVLVLPAIIAEIAWDMCKAMHNPPP